MGGKSGATPSDQRGPPVSGREEWGNPIGPEGTTGEWEGRTGQSLTLQPPL